MADSAVAPRSPGTRVARLAGSILRWVVLLAVATVILIPVAYAVLGGFRNAAQLAANPVGLPDPWIWSNYIDSLTGPSFWVQLRNSILVAAITTTIVVLFGSLAAFVLARRRFRGREVTYTVFTLGLLFPATVAILPLIILLGVPLAVFGALSAQWLRGLSNDVFCQVGLVMLIGLASKNAILIVEFARRRRVAGLSIEMAAMEAARMRLRPILMTAFAFIFGVAPLVFATGAGANSRQSLGTAVFGGMIAATLLSLFVVPVFYVLIERFRERVSGMKKKA